MRIAVDAMGGDNAPGAVVEGCLMALRERADIAVTLAGQRDKLEPLLKDAGDAAGRVEILDAPDVIGMDEAPVMAVRRKPNSSMVKALDEVKRGAAQACVSAGSTGALLAGGMFRVGRIKGIERPALGVVIPSTQKPYILLDSGANAECRPEYLVQFALMGSIYMEKVKGYSSPRVGLVNIGAESEKGNELSKATYPLLEASGLNFTGNIEPRDIPAGAADVVVTDGFTGNVVLKLTEGLAAMLMGMIKTELMASPVTKVGAALAKPAFRSVKKRMDYTEEGGAPLLGVKGAVIKAHGSSNATAIKNALFQAARMVEGGVAEIIEAQVGALKAPEKQDT
ncbi:MAG: phosphate acyltransferase PlsX [Candidatus Fimadaptatus sp.]